MLSWTLLTLAALCLLLASEIRGSTAGKATFKPIASVGFLGLGATSGAGEGAVGVAVAAALLFCFLGDVLLIPKSKLAFRLGLASFLLGHVAYGIAFTLRGVDVGAVGAAGVLLAAIAAPVLRWMWPHLPPKMRPPVSAYVVAISLMVAAAAGAVAAGGPLLLAIGAALFYVSDLFVARNRFVRPGSVNRLIGLPLYYVGQLILAGVAAA